MRRPSRNIEIFSMSVLDMFASALGAFIMVTIILFPYYNDHQILDIKTREVKGVDDEIQSATDKLSDAEEVSRQQNTVIAQTGRIQSESRQCRMNADDCKIMLAKKFLVVQIQWRERADVDLVVIDPDGNRFTYDHNNRTGADFPGTEAQLSVDMKFGPGIEVWQNPSARAGDYRVIYRVANMADPSVTVEGWYIHRNTGRVALPRKVIDFINRDVPVALLRISQSGNIAMLAGN
jgi:hypothetical protein